MNGRARWPCSFLRGRPITKRKCRNSAGVAPGVRSNLAMERASTQHDSYVLISICKRLLARFCRLPGQCAFGRDWGVVRHVFYRQVMTELTIIITTTITTTEPPIKPKSKSTLHPTDTAAQTLSNSTFWGCMLVSAPEFRW